MTNVAKLQPALSMPQLVQQAVASGNIELVERMLKAQQTWEEMQAKKAFNNAIAAWKADPDRPTILKNVEVEFEGNRGRTSYKHEDLSDMLAAVDPSLAKFGLWVRFRAGTTDQAECA